MGIFDMHRFVSSPLDWGASLSADNDPFSQYWLWEVNFEQYGIREIKSVPGIPSSHPLDLDRY
jgi:hypothetical protein